MSGGACGLLTTFMFVAAMVAAAAALGGQGPTDKKPSNTQEKYLPTLEREIHHQIQVLPFYSVFDYIGFRLEGAKVTLIGQVVRPTLKEHAEAAVKSLEGVAVVVNQIELLPASSSDDELRRNIYRAVYEDSVLARYAAQTQPAIRIIVKNGNAFLEGFVESATDKTLAGTRAAGVANVANVRNNLIVQGKGSAGQ